MEGLVCPEGDIGCVWPINLYKVRSFVFVICHLFFYFPSLLEIGFSYGICTLFQHIKELGIVKAKLEVCNCTFLRSKIGSLILDKLFKLL